MDVLTRGRALCVALVIAHAAAPRLAAAQSPIDVPTIVTIPPQEEPPSPTAPRSSFDYETANTTATAPWNAAQSPWNARPGALAAAPGGAASRPTAFTGAAAPLSCSNAGYRMIIDERSDLRAGVVCHLPDGSWQLYP